MLPTIKRSNFRPFYMSDLFDDDFFPVMQNRTNVPAVNIREDDKNYNIEVAIPGLDKKDLKIDIHEDVLTISSESKHEAEENRDGYKRKEFSYSSFARNFYIPENVEKDKIEAGYKDGILNVTLPKMKEEKSRITRQISIS